MKRIDRMSLWERAYLPEILRGLSVTGFHFWRNLSIHILHAFGLARTLQAAVTVQYPEARAPYPDTFRGRHRLTLKADDTANCTACFLCAVACPAECIYIEAGENQTAIEKYAVRYEIDTLRCIYCGLVRRSLSVRCDSHGHRNPARQFRIYQEGFCRGQKDSHGPLARVTSQRQGRALRRVCQPLSESVA